MVLALALALAGSCAGPPACYHRDSDQCLATAGCMHCTSNRGSECTPAGPPPSSVWACTNGTAPGYTVSVLSYPQEPWLSWTATPRSSQWMFAYNPAYLPGHVSTPVLTRMQPARRCVRFVGEFFSF